jgi:hypothetical protein
MYTQVDVSMASNNDEYVLFDDTGAISMDPSSPSPVLLLPHMEYTREKVDGGDSNHNKNHNDNDNTSSRAPQHTLWNEDRKFWADSSSTRITQTLPAHSPPQNDKLAITPITPASSHILINASNTESNPWGQWPSPDRKSRVQPTVSSELSSSPSKPSVVSSDDAWLLPDVPTVTPTIESVYAAKMSSTVVDIVLASPSPTLPG